MTQDDAVTAQRFLDAPTPRRPLTADEALAYARQMQPLMDRNGIIHAKACWRGYCTYPACDCHAAKT